VASLWSESLLASERGAGFEFYKNALASWLTNKKSTTRRSYIGTLVYFFDFVSRRRSEGGAQLRLIAPHQLRQDDVDAYVEHLRRPEKSPEELTDPDERLVFEWMFHELSSRPDIMSSAAIDAMRKEGIDVSFKDYEPQRGFSAAPAKEYSSFDYIIASLCRKRLLSRIIPKADAPGKGKEGKPSRLMLKSESSVNEYRILLASSKPSNSVSTQVQRLAALSSFWQHMLSSNKLGMSRKPSALEPIDPWKEPAAVLTRGKPSDQMLKTARKMSEGDLKKALAKLAKDVLDQPGGLVTIKNVLAARDELAIYFFVCTALRRSEGMMARAENATRAAEAIAVDPTGSLLLLSGIQKKGRRQQESVFVPDMVLKLRSRLFDLMEKFIQDSPAFLERAHSEMEQEMFDRAKRRRVHFNKTFEKALRHRDRGPIVPALGRWGNAMGKAQQKAIETSVQTPDEDYSQVAMDGRSLLARMQQLSDKEERKIKYHPHALRHLSVMLSEGVGDNAALAQAIAGHRSAATTDVYRDMVSLNAMAVLKVSARVSDMMQEAYGQVPPQRRDGEGVVSVPQEETKPVEVEVQPAEAKPEPPKEDTKLADLAKAKAERERIIREYNKDFDRAARASAEAMAAAADMAPRPPMETFMPVTTPPVAKPATISAFTSGEDKKKRKSYKLVLNGIKPARWFLDATHYQGKFSDAWREPIFLNVEQYKGYISEGMIPDGHVLSWFEQDVPWISRAMVVSGPRTGLPYRIAANRKDEADVTFSEDELGLTEASRMKRNPRKASKGDFRLVYLPVLDLSNTAWNRGMMERVTALYEDKRRTDPSAAKSMTRWMSAIMTSSRQVEAAGKAVWVPEDHSFLVEGKDTMSLVEASRVSEGNPVFRRHLASEVADFLENVGSTYYGSIGKMIRFNDANKAESKADEAIMATLDDVDDFQNMKVGNFLRKYKLPLWITATDDPLGDEMHGLSPEEMKQLKSLLNSYMDQGTAIVSFTAEASSLADFWDIIRPFASTEARTIDIRQGSKPFFLQDDLDKFIAVHQVDPIVCCRRFIRNLWEIHKAGKSHFLARDKTTVKKDQIDQIWGLLWSWVLPSSEVSSQMVSSAGQAPSNVTMSKVFERLTDTMSFESLFVSVKDVMERFLGMAEEAVKKSPSMTIREKRSSLEDFDSFVSDCAKMIVEQHGKSFSDPQAMSESMARAISTAFQGRFDADESLRKEAKEGFSAATVGDVIEKYAKIFKDSASSMSVFAARLMLESSSQLRRIVTGGMGEEYMDLSEGEKGVFNEREAGGSVRTTAEQGSFSKEVVRGDEDDLQSMVADSKALAREAIVLNIDEDLSAELASYVVKSSVKDAGQRKALAMGFMKELRPRYEVLKARVALTKFAAANPDSFADVSDVLESYRPGKTDTPEGYKSFVKKADEVMGAVRRGGKRTPKMKPNKGPDLDEKLLGKMLFLDSESARVGPGIFPSLGLLRGIRLSIPTVLFFIHAQPKEAGRRR